MKPVAVVILFAVMAGCAGHSVKCHGPLRPINQRSTGVPSPSPGRGPRPTPADGAKPATDAKPAAEGPRS